MGKWHLEVGKMAIYMTFPVVLFYYFNQPQYFEEWVTKTNRSMYPKANPEHLKALEDAKLYSEEKYEKEMLNMLKNR